MISLPRSFLLRRRSANTTGALLKSCAVYSDQLSNEYSFISSLAEVSSWKDLYDLPSFTFARLTIATAKVLKPYKMLVKEFNATPDAETIKALRKQAAATYNKSIAPLIGISEDQWIGETRNMAPIGEETPGRRHGLQ